MQKLIPWFVNNAVAANLLMLILVAGGLLALPQTHQEEFPTLDVDAVNIQVPYLGDAPAEAKHTVCLPPYPPGADRLVTQVGHVGRLSGWPSGVGLVTVMASDQ